jgi:hypothetical protein
MNFKSATGTLSRRRLVNCCKLVIHFSILCSILLHSNSLHPMFELTKRDFVTVSFGISKWKRQNIVIFIQVNISRHSTSLENCQPFNLAGDGPKNSPRDPIGNFIPPEKYYGDFALFHQSGLKIDDILYTAYDVDALGNCFFLSLAVGLNHCYGERICGLELRNTVTNKINSLTDPIIRYVCFNKNIEFPVPDSTLTNWAKDGEYVEFPLIIFTSFILQVRILVYQPNSSEPCMDTGGLFHLTGDKVVYLYLFNHQNPFGMSQFNHFCVLLPNIAVSSHSVEQDEEVVSQSSSSSLALKLDDSSSAASCPFPSCKNKKKYKKPVKFVPASLVEHINHHINIGNLNGLHIEDDLLKFLFAVQCVDCHLLISSKNKHANRCKECRGSQSQTLSLPSEDLVEQVLEMKMEKEMDVDSTPTEDSPLEFLVSFDHSSIPIDSILNSNAKVLQDVPRRLHNLWAQCVLQVCRVRGLKAVKILLCLPRMLLRGDSWTCEEKMLKFLNGQILELLSPDDLDPTVVIPKTHTSHCEYLIHRNRMHDAWFTLFHGQEPADFTPETLSKLQDLHPPASPNDPMDDPVLQEFLMHHVGPVERNNSVSISNDLLISVLKSFKKGSATGRSGLSHLHLLRACRSDLHGKDCTKQLSGLFEDICNLNFPPEDHPELKQILLSSRLIALQKPNGGLRPIAIGEIARRIVSKILLKQTVSAKFFQNLQFGVGTPNGADGICHTVNAIRVTDPNTCFLKLDVKNAFNSISRKFFLHLVRLYFPEIYTFVNFAYSQSTNLVISETSDYLLSQEGVQQGDPLGPLLFAIGIQPLLWKFQTEFAAKLKLNVWYLDDGTIGVDSCDVLACINFFQTVLPQFGLTLNLHKTEVFNYKPDPHFDALPKEVIRSEELVILGVPLTGSLDTVLQQFELCLMKLSEVSHSQYALKLMQVCVNISKLNHILRTRLDTESFSHRVDTMILDAVFHLAHASANVQNVNPELVPFILGIKMASDIRLPAFVGSSFQCLRLVQEMGGESSFNFVRSLYEDQLKNFNSKYSLSLKTIPKERSQRFLTERAFKVRKSQLLSSLTPEDRQVSLSYGSDMLWSSYILPKNSMMPEEHFKITLSRALRCNLFPARQNCPLCSKNVPADSFGDHYLSCPKGGGLTRRHNRLRDIARTVAVEGSTPCKPEPLHLLLHSDKKPADLLFPSLLHSGPVCLDFTVTAPRVPASLKNSDGLSAGCAARFAYNGKSKLELLNLCKTQGLQFYPIVFEHGGYIHPKSKHWLYAIADLTSQKLELHKQGFRRKFLALLSTALHWENADALLRILHNKIMPPSPPLSQSSLRDVVLDDQV